MAVSHAEIFSLSHVLMYSTTNLLKEDNKDCYNGNDNDEDNNNKNEVEDDKEVNDNDYKDKENKAINNKTMPPKLKPPAAVPAPKTSPPQKSLELKMSPQSCVIAHNDVVQEILKGTVENNGVHFTPKADAMVIQLGVVCTGTVWVKEFLKKLDKVIHNSHTHFQLNSLYSCKV